MNRSIIKSQMKASQSQIREQLYESKYFFSGFEVIDENNNEIISEIIDEQNKKTVQDNIKNAHQHFVQQAVSSRIGLKDKNQIKFLTKGNQNIIMDYLELDQTRSDQLQSQPKGYLVCEKHIGLEIARLFLQDLILLNNHNIKRMIQLQRKQEQLTQLEKEQLEEITLESSYQVAHMLIEQNEGRKEKIEQREQRINKFKKPSLYIYLISLSLFLVFMVLHFLL